MAAIVQISSHVQPFLELECNSLRGIHAQFSTGFLNRSSQLLDRAHTFRNVHTEIASKIEGSASFAPKILEGYGVREVQALVCI